MNDKDTWILKKIEIEFEPFGSEKDQYEGMVRFQNGHWESFNFRIRSDMAERYIELIADDLVKGASRLSNDLMRSLKISSSNEE